MASSSGCFRTKRLTAKDICNVDYNALPDADYGATTTTRGGPPTAFSSTASGRKRKAGTLSESINKQNLKQISESSHQQATSSGDMGGGGQGLASLRGDLSDVDSAMHLMFNTSEGQDQFKKLIAKTKKQKQLCEALKERRKEFEMFLIQSQHDRLREQSEKLERKKRKLEQKKLSDMGVFTNNSGGTSSSSYNSNNSAQHQQAQQAQHYQAQSQQQQPQQSMMTSTTTRRQKTNKEILESFPSHSNANIETQVKQHQ